MFKRTIMIGLMAGVVLSASAAQRMSVSEMSQTVGGDMRFSGNVYIQGKIWKGNYAEYAFDNGNGISVYYYPTNCWVRQDGINRVHPSNTGYYSMAVGSIGIGLPVRVSTWIDGNRYQAGSGGSLINGRYVSGTGSLPPVPFWPFTHLNNQHINAILVNLYSGLTS